MNKRGNEENKKKPDIKYSFKIEKEDELLYRIEKMVAIKNVPNKKELQIQYRDELSKRYGSIPLSEAMDYMKAQQKNWKEIYCLSKLFIFYCKDIFVCLLYFGNRPIFPGLRKPFYVLDSILSQFPPFQDKVV